MVTPGSGARRRRSRRGDRLRRPAPRRTRRCRSDPPRAPPRAGDVEPSETTVTLPSSAAPRGVRLSASTFQERFAGLGVEREHLVTAGEDDRPPAMLGSDSTFPEYDQRCSFSSVCPTRPRSVTPTATFSSFTRAPARRSSTARDGDAAVVLPVLLEERAGLRRATARDEEPTRAPRSPRLSLVRLSGGLALRSGDRGHLHLHAAVRGKLGEQGLDQRSPRLPSGAFSSGRPRLF